MNAIEVPVNGERLMADLKRLRKFGAHGTGVVRTSLSPVDVESRHWLRGRLEDAGLDARIDCCFADYLRMDFPDCFA